MRRFTRAPEPEVLAANWEAWGVAWEERLAAGGRFHWHQTGGRAVNQVLLPLLKQQTQDHCSFCDIFPFDRYFRWDYTRGTLEVNERATAEDQRRAQATILLYRLNEQHPTLRRRELLRRAKIPDEPIDHFPYRDFVGER